MIIILLSIVLGGAYLYNEYNIRPLELSTAKAALSVDASTIVSDYLTNEETANKKYLGKIIEVSGSVAGGDGRNILLGDAQEINNVSCTLDADRQKEFVLPPAGTHLIVRGVCTGFLIDVELNRCVIIND